MRIQNCLGFTGKLSSLVRSGLPLARQGFRSLSGLEDFVRELTPRAVVTPPLVCLEPGGDIRKRIRRENE